jgi:hypothetical protein
MKTQTSPQNHDRWKKIYMGMLGILVEKMETSITRSYSNFTKITSHAE